MALVVKKWTKIVKNCDKRGFFQKKRIKIQNQQTNQHKLY